MSWSGTMTVNVVNQSNGPLSLVTCVHSFNSKNTVAGPQNLAPGASLTFQINVGDGGSDYWGIGFTDAAGNQYYRNGKKCDVEQSDYATHKPIHVNLLPPATGWSIELPASSSCTDNRYSQGFTMP